MVNNQELIVFHQSEWCMKKYCRALVSASILQQRMLGLGLGDRAQIHFQPKAPWLALWKLLVSHTPFKLEQLLPALRWASLGLPVLLFSHYNPRSHHLKPVAKLWWGAELGGGSVVGWPALGWLVVSNRVQGCALCSLISTLKLIGEVTQKFEVGCH